MKGYDPAALGLSGYKVAGHELKLKCPFHADKTPSARFNLINGLFHCFGCGTSANAHQLAKMLDGEVSLIDISAIASEEEAREWRQLLYSPLAIDNEYLLSRRVTNEQIERFGILQCDEGVLFPVKDRKGQTIGLQMRKYEGEPKYILYGERTPVWPMANLKYEYLLLVEGVFGVLNADRHGFKAVCVMGASAIPPAAAALAGHDVKILFDDDLAGYHGAWLFMKLHKQSSAVLPGVEADELTLGELAFNIGKPGSNDIVGFAEKTGRATLLAYLRKEGRKHERKTKGKDRATGARARYTLSRW